MNVMAVEAQLKEGTAARLRVVGGVALVVCLFDAGWVIWGRAMPEDLLWVCRLGAWGVALGLLLRVSVLNSVGTLWLAYGMPLWLGSLLMGDSTELPSVLIHVGNLALGVWGARALGLTPHAWLKALAALLVVQAISRAATPPASNVNLVFNVFPGWEWLSYPVFYGGFLLLGVAAFALSERGVRRLSEHKR